MKEQYEESSLEKLRKQKIIRIFYTCTAILIGLGCLWILFFSGAKVEDPSVIAEREGKTVLRLWNPRGDIDQRSIVIIDKVEAELDKQFFQSHPDIIPGRTTRLQIPETARDGSLLMALAGGTAPSQLNFPIYQAQTLMDQGFLEPLERFIEAEKKKDPDFEKRIYIPEKLLPVVTRYNPESGRYERYGLNKNYGIKALLYRKDLFVEAGLDPNRPPQTWDELFEYTIKLTRPEKKIPGSKMKRGQIGLGARDHASVFMNFIWEAGGDFVRQYKFCPHHREEVSVPKEDRFETCPVCGGDLLKIPVQWKVSWASEAGAVALDFMKKLSWQPWIRVKDEEGNEKEYFFTYEQYDNRESVTMEDGRVFDLNDDEVYNRIHQGGAYFEDPGGGGRITRQMYRMIAQGELAMFLFPVNEENFVNLEREGVRFDLISLAAPPMGPAGNRHTHMSGGMRGINSQVSEKEKWAAWEYVKYQCGEQAWRTKTRIYVENGMYFAVRPHLLEKFGFHEFYKKVDPGMIKFYEEIHENARSMPWNEGWLPINSSILPDAMSSVIKIAGGYRKNSLEVLKHYQEQANKTVMKVKDEAYYGKIRKFAYVIFALVVIFFIWAMIFITKSKTQEKLTSGMQLDIVGIKTPGYVIKRTIIAWLFLLPAIATVLLWRYYPLSRGAGMAFYQYKLLEGFKSPFVGIDNFIDIFHQPLFYEVMFNTVYYVGLTLGLGFFVPIILALFLDEVPKGKLFFRIIFYLPAIMSPLVTLLLWELLYEPTSAGLLNQLLMKIGLVTEKEPFQFLNSPRWAMLCIIIPGIWAHAGPGCIIYLAALKVVPEDLYEAVAVDGGNWWHKLRMVTFPALAPLIVINFIGAFIHAWQAMQNIFVLTGGGPLNATRVIGIEIWYNAFIYLRFGYSTSMAWILASLLIGFTVMQMRMFSKVEFKTAQGN